MDSKFIGVGIGALIVMVIGVIVIYPLINKISATTDLGGSGSPLSSLMSLFPLVVAIGIIMAIAGMFMKFFMVFPALFFVSIGLICFVLSFFFYSLLFFLCGAISLLIGFLYFISIMQLKG